ncbi:hypothetical protein DJ66_0411 [Candidatus Liberibacter solanacearum]|uniref:Uncharacterized protein n=1 Tax=Candidatus Liberibacter solanacearum TaxID=556287 RepID=A0A0F4VJZ2_9HYPH|nr:hypothetical protein [Candidatus Liberibacter solanacearum]KJZ81689.1 hypothetical protein DJ66_0411 [Candidatus Liberibacter solanacearum]
MADLVFQSVWVLSHGLRMEDLKTVEAIAKATEKPLYLSKAVEAS